MEVRGPSDEREFGPAPPFENVGSFGEDSRVGVEPARVAPPWPTFRLTRDGIVVAFVPDGSALRCGDRLLTVDGLAFHDYGKEPRPGRKLGHCTILKSRAAERDSALADVLKSIEWT